MSHALHVHSTLCNFASHFATVHSSGTKTPCGEPDFRSGVTGDVIHFNATQNVMMGHQYVVPLIASSDRKTQHERSIIVFSNRHLCGCCDEWDQSLVSNALVTIISDLTSVYLVATLKSASLSSVHTHMHLFSVFSVRMQTHFLQVLGGLSARGDG